MRKAEIVILAMVLAGCALASATGLAQDRPVLPTPEAVPMDTGTADVVAPDAYGTTGTTVVKIHGSAFRSQSSGDNLEAYGNTGITYRSAGNIFAVLHAPVQLPAGAIVTGVGFDGYDVDPAIDISWGIYWVSESNADTTGDLGWYTPTQSGGSFNASATITPHTVDPGKYYFAMVQMPKLGQDLRIKGMRITYKLQVSPAPASATFSDVPVGYWAFQYVEALAAAGITGGCGGGLYCPGNPVTRAEMAVFISKALGLHYPN